MFPSEFALMLLRHPATPAPVVRSVAVHAVRSADGGLEIAYCLRGDMARLLIPEPRIPACANGLWKHSCFEAFVGVAGDAAYHEFNFSPSGQWAAYAFSSYRQRDESRLLLLAPQISARLFAGRLELEAVIRPEALPSRAQTATLQIGLTAVVEAADVVEGSHSYWALGHSDAFPDFHRREGFTLDLAPPQCST